MASLAQVVNAIAPLLTRGDDMLRQTTYYPLVMFANGGMVCPCARMSRPRYTSQVYGEVCGIDTSAILDEDSLHVFIVNRSLIRPPVWLWIWKVYQAGNSGIFSQVNTQPSKHI
jgi:alpha-N-arabinofuranosidase